MILGTEKEQQTVESLEAYIGWGNRLPISQYKDFPGGLVVRTLPSNAGSTGFISTQGAKTHMSALWPKNWNIKRSNIVRNSIKTFKMVHIKEKKEFFKNIMSSDAWTKFKQGERGRKEGGKEAVSIRQVRKRHLKSPEWDKERAIQAPTGSVF